MDEIMVYRNQNELYHHGILGQKWGVRRYQNYDGTLTDKGKKRYANMTTEQQKSFDKKTAKELKKHTLSAEENLRKYAQEEEAETKNLADAKAAYEKANKEYQYNANGFFGKGVTEADRHNLNAVEDTYNTAKKNSDKAKTNLAAAEKVYDNYASQYKKTVDTMVEKYGSESVNTYSAKTVKMGETYAKQVLNLGQYGVLSGKTKYEKSGKRSQKDYVNEDVDTLMRDYTKEY